MLIIQKSNVIIWMLSCCCFFLSKAIFQILQPTIISYRIKWSFSKICKKDAVPLVACRSHLLIFKKNFKKAVSFYATCHCLLFNLLNISFYWVNPGCLVGLKWNHLFPCFFSDRHQGLSLWVPFQNAASNVTSLYKGMCSFSVKVASQLMNKTVSISFFFFM